MTDQELNDLDDDTPIYEISEPAPESADTDEQPQAPEESPEQVLRRERDELEARLLRVSADYQNYVRRSQQNTTAATEQQLMEMARALLTVMDHFDHALNVDPDSSTPQSLLQGVQIVRDELLKTLEQFGVQRFDVAVGDEFDPTQHQAMMRQTAEGLESNHVAAQLQPGYSLGDKTLRPAKVAVTE